MFYTTDISVTLWILNKNKKAHSRSIGDEQRHYRDREKEILFMDLRQIGEPFEKKFTQFSEQQILDIAKTYHTWQQQKTDYTKIFLNIAIQPRLMK
jgi:type I restriction enzyme M protein